MIRKWLERLRQTWKHRHMIAAIIVVHKLSMRELRDIADYAVELYRLRLREEARG